MFPLVCVLAVSRNKGQGSSGYPQSPFGSSSSFFGFPSPPGNLGTSVNFQGTGIASDRSSTEPLTSNVLASPNAVGTSLVSSGGSASVAGSQLKPSTPNFSQSNAVSASTPFSSEASYTGGASPRASTFGTGNIRPTSISNDQSLSDLFFANQQGNPAAALLPSGGFKKEFDASLPGASSGSYANSIMSGDEYNDPYDYSNSNDFYDSDYQTKDASTNHGNKYSDSNSDYQGSSYDYSDGDPNDYHGNTNNRRPSYDYDDGYYDDYGSNDNQDRKGVNSATGSYSNNDKDNDNYKYTNYDHESNRGYSINNDNLDDYKGTGYDDYSDDEYYNKDQFVPSSYSSQSGSSSSSPTHSSSSPSSSSSYTPYKSTLSSDQSGKDDYHYDDYGEYKDYPDSYWSNDYPDSSEYSRSGERESPQHLQPGGENTPSNHGNTHSNADYDSSYGKYHSGTREKEAASNNQAPPPDGYIANYDIDGREDSYYDDPSPPPAHAYVPSNGLIRGSSSVSHGNAYSPRDSRYYPEPEIATSFDSGDQMDKERTYINGQDYSDFSPIDDPHETLDTSYYPPKAGKGDAEDQSYNRQAPSPYDKVPSVSDRPSPFSYDNSGIEASDQDNVNHLPPSSSGHQQDYYHDSSQASPDNNYGSSEQLNPSSSDTTSSGSSSSPSSDHLTDIPDSPSSISGELDSGYPGFSHTSPEFIGPAVSSTSLLIVPDDNPLVLLPTSEEEPKPFVSKGPQPFSRSKK